MPYVCMYVCACVWVYVCMHAVCLQVSMHYALFMYVCLYVCIYVLCLYVCMFQCMPKYMYTTKQSGFALKTFRDYPVMKDFFILNLYISKPSRPRYSYLAQSNCLVLPSRTNFPPLVRTALTQYLHILSMVFSH